MRRLLVATIALVQAFVVLFVVYELLTMLPAALWLKMPEGTVTAAMLIVIGFKAGAATLAAASFWGLGRLRRRFQKESVASIQVG